MKRLFIIPAAALVLFLSLSAAGFCETDPAVIERAALSAVRLEVFDERGDRIGTGSGFSVLDPRILVTAEHVIVNMAYMIATRDDGTQFRIERVLVTDSAADIALCALPEDAGLPPLSLADGKPLRGEEVVAVGSQFGLTNLVSLGHVSGRWEAEKTDWILFTAPVSAGCSGGPLLNSEGTVIGIIMGTYEKAQNLNLAAPAEKLQSLYENP